MNHVSTVEHLYAGKPQAFGPKGSPSSIVKQDHSHLTIKYDGALEDEQGNKKLHGGPFMALHQYSQSAYKRLASAFPNAPLAIHLGTIGENISAPNMTEKDVFIGDLYSIGEAVLKVVSPRAPCAKINHRYGIRNIDLYVAKHDITGWYFSVEQEGRISVNDDIELVHRERTALSVAQIWQLRKLVIPCDNPSKWLTLANQAVDEPALAPEWQAHLHRIATKLSKLV